MRWPLCPLLLPSLKHKNSPKLDGPVPFSMKVFRPRSANRYWIEYALLSQFSGVEEVFNPRAERAAEPLPQGQAKAHLGAVEKLRRNITPQHRPKNPLPLPLMDFEVQGQLPCDFHESIIQERHSGFQTHGHTGAI